MIVLIFYEILFGKYFRFIPHSTKGESQKENGLFSHSVMPHSLWPLPFTMLKLTFIASVMPSHHLISCHPLLLLLSIFPSIRVFSNELALCKWMKAIMAQSLTPNEDKISKRDVKKYNGPQTFLEVNKFKHYCALLIHWVNWFSWDLRSLQTQRIHYSYWQYV